MAYVGSAYLVMAYAVMLYMVMAYIVMAHIFEPSSTVALRSYDIPTQSWPT